MAIRGLEIAFVRKRGKTLPSSSAPVCWGSREREGRVFFLFPTRGEGQRWGSLHVPRAVRIDLPRVVTRTASVA